MHTLRKHSIPHPPDSILLVMEWPLPEFQTDPFLLMKIKGRKGGSVGL